MNPVFDIENESTRKSISRKRKRPLPSLIPLAPPAEVIPLHQQPTYDIIPISFIPIGDSTCSITDFLEEQPTEKIQEEKTDKQSVKNEDDSETFVITGNFDEESSPIKNAEDDNETLIINFEEKSEKNSPMKKSKSKNTIYLCKICQPNEIFKIW